MRKVITAKTPFYNKVKKEKVHSDILEIIPLFDSLPQDKKDFIIKLYLKSYEYGVRSVKDDIFTNCKLTTYQELSDRFNNYPDIENKNIELLKKVAEENKDALDKILDKTSNQDDFVYETYQENFIDKSMDVIHTMSIPKGYEEIDIYLISQDAFAYGVMKKVDYLAKESISKWSKKMIEEA